MVTPLSLSVTWTEIVVIPFSLRLGTRFMVRDDPVPLVLMDESGSIDWSDEVISTSRSLDNVSASEILKATSRLESSFTSLFPMTSITGSVLA